MDYDSKRIMELVALLYLLRNSTFTIWSNNAGNIYNEILRSFKRKEGAKMRRHSFVLTRSLFLSISSRDGKLPNCSQCGKLFRIGDKIVSVLNRRYAHEGHVRRFHKHCAVQLNIW